jgi:nitrate/TMAO reductase-like tetraheme cytochrome c subunit
MSLSHAEYQKQYYRSNRDKLLAQAKERAKTVSGEANARNSHLKHKYGISLFEWNKMFEMQKGVCPICHRHQDEIHHRLCVDHDHVTGKIRKLVCRDCNLILGHAFDNIDVLESAIKYLKENNHG